MFKCLEKWNVKVWRGEEFTIVAETEFSYYVAGETEKAVGEIEWGKGAGPFFETENEFVDGGLDVGFEGCDCGFAEGGIHSRSA